jgi:two-component sensor histidine kinase
MLPEDVAADPFVADAIARARQKHEPVIVEQVGAERNDRLLQFLLPLQSEPGGAYRGALLGQIEFTEMFRELLDPQMATEFNLTLMDQQGRTRLRQGGDAAVEWLAKSLPAERVRILDSDWELHVLPTGQTSGGRSTVPQAAVLLLAGTVLALLASGVMLQSALHRRRDRRIAREHLDAVSALNAVSAALTADPGGSMRVLEKLVGQVQRFLRMPIGAVMLFKSDGRSLHVVYGAGVDPDKPYKTTWDIDELPGLRSCLQTGRILLMPDMLKQPGPFDVATASLYDVRSFLFMPMVANNKPLGVIILCDRVPRRLSDMEIRMAQLWGAQAAVILAQGRLYQQLRHQIDANETLLRELNHRVKNNLAGIVGLLQMDHPELSQDAGEWLDRVTARVETMARAHELFSVGGGGAGMQSEVRIKELVDKTLSTIRAITPPGVSIDVDVSPLQRTPLSTDRAVTLAMVLHELCYNALVHGVGTDGAISVRGRVVSPQRIAIDVIDRRGSDSNNGADGRNGNGSTRPRSSGMGLELVRAFVGRELRGQLTLADVTRLEGDGHAGTVATVEFPLDPAAEPQQQHEQHDHQEPQQPTPADRSDK